MTFRTEPSVLARIAVSGNTACPACSCCRCCWF